MKRNLQNRKLRFSLKRVFWVLWKVSSKTRERMISLNTTLRKTNGVRSWQKICPLHPGIDTFLSFTKSLFTSSEDTTALTELMISLNTIFWQIPGKKFSALAEEIPQHLGTLILHQFMVIRCMFLEGMMENIRMICFDLVLTQMNGLKFLKSRVQTGPRRDIEHTVLFIKTRCSYLEAMMEVNSWMISTALISKQTFGQKLCMNDQNLLLPEILIFLSLTENQSFYLEDLQETPDQTFMSIKSQRMIGSKSYTKMARFLHQGFAMLE